MKIFPNLIVNKLQMQPAFKQNPAILKSLSQKGDSFVSYYDRISTLSNRWYEQNKELVKKIYEDKDGNILLSNTEGQMVSHKFSDIMKEYDGELGVLVHGTDDFTYEQIKKNGFKLRKDHFAETIRGIYFTLENDGKNTYGTKKVYAKFHGSVYLADTNKILCLKYHKTMLDYLKKLGIENDVTADEVALAYLKDKMKTHNIDGLLSIGKSAFANCRYFVTDKLDAIEILDK